MYVVSANDTVLRWLPIFQTIRNPVLFIMWVLQFIDITFKFLFLQNVTSHFYLVKAKTSLSTIGKSMVPLVSAMDDLLISIISRMVFHTELGGSLWASTVGFILFIGSQGVVADVNPFGIKPEIFDCSWYQFNNKFKKYYQHFVMNSISWECGMDLVKRECNSKGRKI